MEGAVTRPGALQGTSWQASVLEVGAHIARAETDVDSAVRLLDEAADIFHGTAQPLDAARCRPASRSWAIPEPASGS
jgi:hypothetical protein